MVKHAVTDQLGMIAGGAVRSGKTTAQVLSFAVWSAHNAVGYDTCLVGNSVESAMRNVGFPLIDCYRELGIPADMTRSLGTRIVWEHGGRKNNIWVIGASDERSKKRIQGMTLLGLMVDEVVLIPEEAFNMALSRLSEEGAKLWATFNPESPQHWFKKRIIDHLPEMDSELIMFTMDDNPSLSEAIKERYRKSFTGHWKKRYIDGEWAGASGLIYPSWQQGEVNPFDAVAPILALDWGISNRFAALMFKKNCLVAEQVHDSGEMGYMTETQHRDALQAWVAEHNNGSTRNVKIYVDPSTPPTFKRELRKVGFIVAHADNDVIPGVVTTSTRLAAGDVTLGICPKTIEEIYGYTWDARKADVGEDAPVKMNDHCMDALRYYCHSTGKLYRQIGRLPNAKQIMAGRR